MAKRNIIIIPKYGTSKGERLDARLMAYGLYEVETPFGIIEFAPEDVDVVGKRIYNETEGVHEIISV